MEKQIKQIRVLHILGTMDMGGIENFLMNIYRNIDRTKIQFDFIINDRGKEDIFENEIKKFGGKIYKIPSIVDSGHYSYLKNLRNILNKNNYKIVHSHYNMVSGFILREAQKCGIKIRISHSHSTKDRSLERFNLKTIYKLYSKYLISKYATRRFACSKKAGEWLFKNKSFEIINNGIDIKKFSFDKEKRENVRKKLGIENKIFAIINVARMTLSKNHIFMIEIMKKLEKLEPDIKLYLIGDGELREEIEENIKRYNLKNIELLGIQDNVNELLNGMDLMLFPSVYEGLGIVTIESQINGLYVLASNTIPEEADLKLGIFKTLSLDLDIMNWVKVIIKLKNNLKQNKRERKEKANYSNYDIKEIAKKMEKIYEKFCDESEKI